MGAAAVPIALAVAGAGASAYNTHRTAKKQDQAAAEGIRRQGEEQEKANLRLNETLKFFEDSGSEDIRANLADRYGNQLRLKQAQALAGLDQEGADSTAYVDKAARVGGQVLDRADITSGLFARQDAPVEQRLGEGIERSELGSDLGVFKRNSAAEDYLTRLRVASKQRSPWLDILAAGLSGASGGVAGGIGGGVGGTTAAGFGNVNPAISAASGASLPGQVFLPPPKLAKFGSIFKI